MNPFDELESHIDSISRYVEVIYANYATKTDIRKARNQVILCLIGLALVNVVMAAAVHA